MDGRYSITQRPNRVRFARPLRCAAGSAPLRYGIIGLVVEYIVAIDVTRVRFPDDALFLFFAFMTFLDLTTVITIYKTFMFFQVGYK